EGEDRIDQFIVKMVATVTPPAMLTTNMIMVSTNITVEITNVPTTAEATSLNNSNPPVARSSEVSRTSGKTTQTVLPSFAQDEQAIKARKAVARNINDFIQNTRSGALGVTGSVALIFVAISMLSRI